MMLLAQFVGVAATQLRQRAFGGTRLLNHSETCFGHVRRVKCLASPLQQSQIVLHAAVFDGVNKGNGKLTGVDRVVRRSCQDAKHGCRYHKILGKHSFRWNVSYRCGLIPKLSQRQRLRLVQRVEIAAWHAGWRDKIQMCPQLKIGSANSGFHLQKHVTKGPTAVSPHYHRKLAPEARLKKFIRECDGIGFLK